LGFKFIPFDDAHREAWDAFVAGNPHAWPGQDTAIIDLEQSLGHESFSHLAYGDDGKLLAVAPMFLLTHQQARFFRFRTLSTGSSLRGGPLLRADLSPKVRLQFLSDWTAQLGDLARRARIDIIRVAYPHVIGDRLSRDFYDYYPLRDYGYTEQARLTLLLDLTIPGKLFDRLTPACRKAVRRAQKGGAEFQPVSDRETWMGFYDLNLEFFEKKQSSPYSKQSLAILWDRFLARGLAHAFCIRHEGRAICVTLVVGTRHSSYAWIGFYKIPRPVVGASNLLMYEIIECMRKSGTHFFEIGSLEFDDPGQRAISDFKQSFGGRAHYGLEGVRVMSELKQASVDWLRAMSAVLRRKAPSVVHRSLPPSGVTEPPNPHNSRI
jgi:hypothetical protein